jgi:hypothetical protein
VRNRVARIDELLALPDWVFPVAGLALGYPEAKEPLSVRLALSATVHTDRYDNAALERELAAYDSRRGRDWSGRQSPPIQHRLARRLRRARQAQEIPVGLIATKLSPRPPSPEEVDDREQDYRPQKRHQERADAEVALVDRAGAEERREQQAAKERTHYAHDHVEHNALLVVRLHDDAGEPAEDATDNEPKNEIHRRSSK